MLHYQAHHITIRYTRCMTGFLSGLQTDLAGAADHDVVAVAISDAQHVGGNAVARTRQGELLNGTVQCIPVIVSATHTQPASISP